MWTHHWNLEFGLIICWTDYLVFASLLMMFCCLMNGYTNCVDRFGYWKLDGSTTIQDETNLVLVTINITSVYKQNRESTEGYPKSIVRKNNDKFGKGLVSISRTYASPKGTGPGVRRSKRPLSACHTRRICSMETTQNSVKGRVLYKV